MDSLRKKASAFVIVRRPSGEILCTVESGKIGVPGGKCEPEDEGLQWWENTASREFNEEVGVALPRATSSGYLAWGTDRYQIRFAVLDVDSDTANEMPSRSPEAAITKIMWAHPRDLAWNKLRPHVRAAFAMLKNDVIARDTARSTKREQHAKLAPVDPKPEAQPEARLEAQFEAKDDGPPRHSYHDTDSLYTGEPNIEEGPADADRQALKISMDRLDRISGEMAEYAAAELLSYGMEQLSVMPDIPHCLRQPVLTHARPYQPRGAPAHRPTKNADKRRQEGVLNSSASGPSAKPATHASGKQSRESMPVARRAVPAAQPTIPVLAATTPSLSALAATTPALSALAATTPALSALAVTAPSLSALAATAPSLLALAAPAAIDMPATDTNTAPGE
jgi:8-oxo-dGTP pyrophosphatase MutT (NUDIX family)